MKGFGFGARIFRSAHLSWNQIKTFAAVPLSLSSNWGPKFVSLANGHSEEGGCFELVKIAGLSPELVERTTL